MANIKISQLFPTVGVLATDVFASVQNGVTVKQSATQLLDFIQDNIVLTESQVTGLIADLSTKLTASNNLLDLTNAVTARTNLGLGAAALQPLSAFLQPSNNLSDLTNQVQAGVNLGLGDAAYRASSSFLQTSSNLSDVPNKSTARSNLQLGSASLQDTTFFLQVNQNLGDLTNTATARNSLGLGSSATQPITDFLQTDLNLSDLFSASTARNNLQLGTSAIQDTSFFLNTSANLNDVPNKSTAVTNLQAVHLNGDTMTGPLILNSNPSIVLQASTKGYVDTSVIGNLTSTIVQVTVLDASSYSYSIICQGVGGYIVVLPPAGPAYENRSIQFKIETTGVGSAGNITLIGDLGNTIDGLSQLILAPGSNIQLTVVNGNFYTSFNGFGQSYFCGPMNFSADGYAAGIVELTSLSVSVSNPFVTGSSGIICTARDTNTQPYCSSINPGVGFAIHSGNAIIGGLVTWMLINRY